MSTDENRLIQALAMVRKHASVPLLLVAKPMDKTSWEDLSIHRTRLASRVWRYAVGSKVLTFSGFISKEDAIRRIGIQELIEHAALRLPLKPDRAKALRILPASKRRLVWDYRGFARLPVGSLVETTLFHHQEADAPTWYTTRVYQITPTKVVLMRQIPSGTAGVRRIELIRNPSAGGRLPNSAAVKELYGRTLSEEEQARRHV